MSNGGLHRGWGGGGGRDKFGLYRHFCLRHPEADIIIEEDGELPKCDFCGMQAKDLAKHKNLLFVKKQGREEVSN